ncbi:MAG: CRISPR-associated protein Cas2, partial [Alphaproteobacteria bacterium]
SVYLVSYDLVKEKKNAQHDYQVLWDELERLGAHRAQYSAWLVNLNMTPQEVVQHFRQFVDDNDRIWASKLFRGQYWYVNAIGGTNAWLDANPPESR